MRRTTLTVEFVTPCFLGGADPTAAAEWRSSSVRGQLRWWFRAVAGGRFGGDLAAVQDAERKLFGDTRRASVLRLGTLGRPRSARPADSEGVPWKDPRMDEEWLAEVWGLKRSDPEYTATLNRLRVTARNGRSIASSPIQYLGYGCIGFKGLERPCILPQETAKLRLQWLERDWQALPAELGGLFRDALWCWLHLGGIGAKSRKGFGSLRCVGIAGDLPAGAGHLPGIEKGTVKQFDQRAREFLAAGTGNAVPEWTHFSSASRIFRSRQACGSWIEAMARAGGWLIAFRRRYGSNGDCRRRRGTALKDRDYAWAAPQAEGQPDFRQGFPDRAGFGLPLPFEKKDRFARDGVVGESVNWRSAGRKGDKENRRASPLLIHVACFGGKEFYPVLTHLPARFLPRGAELTFRRGRQTAAPSSEQADVIDHFCDHLAAKRIVEEVK